MKYEIIGNVVPAIEMELNKGETVFTQSGGMVWEDEGIEMKTNAKGGVMQGLGRMFAGESLFMANYTATQDGAKIAFASTMPGKIIAYDIGEGNDGIIAQKGAFLCAEEGVNVKATLTKNIGAGFFGGEGFILQDIHGKGKAFLEVDGDAVIRDLKPGETIKISTGNVVAFDKTCQYEIATVKGLGNIFFGGEGLFLTKIVGPGRVILQTQDYKEFASRVLSLAPKSR